MRSRQTMALAATLAATLLGSCETTPEASPQAAFWQALESHCGKAYAGSLASDDARDADWADRRMIAHWADCEPDRIAIAFHVEEADLTGWDRSRTWLVSRTGDGLRLKHDHRHEDGEEDAVTQYGGDTASGGGPGGQDFPVDDYSIALFEREGLSASLTNVWRVEVDPAGKDNARFAYQLTKENDPTRLFRVEFDLTRPIDPPPPAWGW